MWRRTFVFCCAALVLTSFSYGQGPRGPKRPEGAEHPGRPEGHDGPEHRKRPEANEQGDKAHDSAMHDSGRNGHKKPSAKSHRPPAKHSKHGLQNGHSRKSSKHAKREQMHAGNAKAHRVAPEHVSHRHQSHGKGSYGKPGHRNQAHKSTGPSAPMMHVDAMMKRLDRNHDQQLSREELAGMMSMFMARGGHASAFGLQRGPLHGPVAQGRPSFEGRLNSMRHDSSMGRPSPQQFARHRFHPDVNAPIHRPPRDKEHAEAGERQRPDGARPEAREHDRPHPAARERGNVDWETLKLDSREPDRGWPEDRKAEDHRPEHREPEHREPEHREPEHREPTPREAE